MHKVRAQLVALLEPVVEGLGYELVDLEVVVHARNRVLRLYIDAPGGIRVEDCEAVSRQVSDRLEVEDPLKGNYALEVSSPGLDRKLVRPAHFDRFAGQGVQGRLKQALNGRRNFTGVLVGRAGANVTIRLKDDGRELTVPIDDLDVIRLIPEI
jgi:ribosome maturation factor RimP